MEQLLTRHAEPVAREILSYMPALIIEGARQVGKSTLASQLAADGRGMVVTLDDQPTREAAEEDPPGFLAQAGGRLLVIDEVQRFPELTLAVKTAIDRDRQPGRFIMTGSSSLWRVRGLADSLAGRTGRLNLYGFSQGELAGRTDDFMAAVSHGLPDPMPSFTSRWVRDDYVQAVTAGAYPAVRTMTDRQQRRWFGDYVEGLVRRDMPELRRMVDPDRAESVLRLLAANQAGELIKARLAQESGIPATSIDGYLDLIVDLWLATTLPSWTPNLTQREIGRRKSFVVDSGLAAFLSRLTAAQLGTADYGVAFGSLLEGFVAAELLRQQTWSATDFDLYHYRARTGAEVDLVAELSGGGVVAVEVKAATSFQASQFRHLRTIRDELGDRFLAGLVLNTGRSGYRFADRLYGLPVSALWEL